MSTRKSKQTVVDMKRNVCTTWNYDTLCPKSRQKTTLTTFTFQSLFINLTQNFNFGEFQLSVETCTLTALSCLLFFIFSVQITSTNTTNKHRETYFVRERVVSKTNFRTVSVPSITFTFSFLLYLIDFIY